MCQQARELPGYARHDNRRLDAQTRTTLLFVVERAVRLEVDTGIEDEEDKEKKELAIVKKASEEEDKQVDVMAPKKDTRSAAVDGWKFKVRIQIPLSHVIILITKLTT